MRRGDTVSSIEGQVLELGLGVSFFFSWLRRFGEPPSSQLGKSRFPRCSCSRVLGERGEQEGVGSVCIFSWSQCYVSHTRLGVLVSFSKGVCLVVVPNPLNGAERLSPFGVPAFSVEE